MSNTLTIELPEGMSAQEAKRLLALAMMREGVASLAGAAQFAGVPLEEWMDVVRAAGLPLTQYDEQDLAEDMKVVNRTRA